MGPRTRRVEKSNPDLVYARISDYGQTGPYAHRPGYAAVCEGLGGLRYLNGVPGDPPVRMNLSLGDTLAGLHAAFEVLLGLINRQGRDGGGGQVIDVSLLESVFNMLEAVVPEYDGAGVIGQPSGSTVTGIAPTNTYHCRDGKFVIIGGNGDSIFRRLMRAAGRSDLADDPRLSENTGRVANEAEIDDAITALTTTLGSVLAELEAAEVPSGPIYSVADVAEDPQIKARELFESAEYDGRAVKVPAIVPRLADTPGRTDWAGPDVGAHTDEILTNVLKLDPEEILELRERKVI